MCWQGYSGRLRTLAAAGRLAPGRAQNLRRMACYSFQVCIFDAAGVKSAFALLSAKVTKPAPFPALI